MIRFENHTQKNLQNVEYDAAIRHPNEEANIDMLTATLKTRNEFLMFSRLSKIRSLDHRPRWIQVLGNLWYWRSKRLNQRIYSKISHRLPEQINIQFITPHTDTIANMKFFLVDENRKWPVESRRVLSSEAMMTEIIGQVIIGRIEVTSR